MRPVLIVVALCLLGLRAAADFQGGLAAFERGDLTAALAQWLPDADRGDPNAQYNVGQLYAWGGKGVERDYAYAATWYRKAAEKGVATAQFNLGLLYDSSKDYNRAIEWYRRAARQATLRQ